MGERKWVLSAEAGTLRWSGVEIPVANSSLRSLMETSRTKKPTPPTTSQAFGTQGSASSSMSALLTPCKWGQLHLPILQMGHRGGNW